MTYRIKPLVWCPVDSGNSYQSTHGGFTVKLDSSGWVWRRGHIFGIASSRQDAFDSANKRHIYEVGFLLEPTEPLAAALALPEIKALVDAALSALGEYENDLYSIKTGIYLKRAIAALIKEGGDGAGLKRGN